MHQSTELPLKPPGLLGAISAFLIAASALSGLLAGHATVVQAVSACDAPYNPVINPADFTDSHGKPNAINNPYFPLVPGTTFSYQGVDDGQPATDVVQVTRNTKTILGVTTTVVRDEVRENGQLAESTLDYYAQDDGGTVWYFGEDTTTYDTTTGQPISTEGSWQAGVNGAKPGIIMEATPNSGDTYRQEFAPGVAEDMATNVSTTKSVSVPYGSFTNALETKEFSCVETGTSHKYYAKGVGLVMEDAGGHEHIELVSVTH